MSVGATSVVVALSSSQVLASPSEEVLGESAQPQLTIPPTSEGPGLILPDSPLYFLDKLKQEVRLILAFTPEEKAKVYASVAGERLAEFRIMLVRNNQNGAQTALNGVSYNFAKTAESIADAQLTGHNISLLAENINIDIKAKQKTLDDLEAQAGVVLKPQLAAATQALLGAKVKVEGALPLPLLRNEVKDDVQRLFTKNLTKSSDLARDIDNEIMHLQKQASDDSSKLRLMHREEALRKAMARKDEAAIKLQQKMMEEDKKKLQTLLDMQQKTAQDVKEATQKLQEATQRYQKIQDYINQLKNTGNIQSTDSMIPTPTTIPSTAK